MKKALALLILAAIIGIGFRYAFPKELLFPPKEKYHIDEMLAETLEKDVKNQPIDSIKPTTIAKDTVKHTTQKKVPEKAQKEVTTLAEKPLERFFEKLRTLEQKKKGQIRIAYFGDSMIDADMLVMQFRHYLQKRFGGYGVGFVPITSVSASGRYSIKHSFSDNWQKQSFLKKNDTIFPFGIIGETYFTGDTTHSTKASVTYKKGSAYRELPLLNPQLLYGKRRKYDSLQMQPIVATIETEDIQDSVMLSGSNLLNIIKLPSSKKLLKISIEDCGSLPLYGTSFASQTGIIVDNLSVRGNSGLPLTRLRTELMRQFDKFFEYDLIIMSYGTNVFSPDYSKGYGWYGKRMRRVVAHLKGCFKNADIIIVSMADRAIKKDTELETPSGLADFIQVQRRIAESTNTAFFNLYNAMGGAGSMIEWAEADPALANKDYTHFNSKGAEKAGKLFYKWLMNAYENHLKKTAKIAEQERVPTASSAQQTNTLTP